MVLLASCIVNALPILTIAIEFSNFSKKPTTFQKRMFIGVGTDVPEVIVPVDKAATIHRRRDFKEISQS